MVSFISNTKTRLNRFVLAFVGLFVAAVGFLAWYNWQLTNQNQAIQSFLLQQHRVTDGILRQKALVTASKTNSKVQRNALVHQIELSWYNLVTNANLLLLSSGQLDSAQERQNLTAIEQYQSVLTDFKQAVKQLNSLEQQDDLIKQDTLMAIRLLDNGLVQYIESNRQTGNQQLSNEWLSILDLKKRVDQLTFILEQQNRQVSNSEYDLFVSASDQQVLRNFFTDNDTIFTAYSSVKEALLASSRFTKTDASAPAQLNIVEANANKQLALLDLFDQQLQSLTPIQPQILKNSHPWLRQMRVSEQQWLLIIATSLGLLLFICCYQLARSSRSLVYFVNKLMSTLSGAQVDPQQLDFEEQQQLAQCFWQQLLSMPRHQGQIEIARLITLDQGCYWQYCHAEQQLVWYCSPTHPLYAYSQQSSLFWLRRLGQKQLTTLRQALNQQTQDNQLTSSHEFEITIAGQRTQFLLQVFMSASNSIGRITKLSSAESTPVSTVDPPLTQQLALMSWRHNLMLWRQIHRHWQQLGKQDSVDNAKAFSWLQIPSVNALPGKQTHSVYFPDLIAAAFVPEQMRGNENNYSLSIASTLARQIQVDQYRLSLLFLLLRQLTMPMSGLRTNIEFAATHLGNQQLNLKISAQLDQVDNQLIQAFNSGEQVELPSALNNLNQLIMTLCQDLAISVTYPLIQNSPGTLELTLPLTLDQVESVPEHVFADLSVMLVSGQVEKNKQLAAAFANNIKQLNQVNELPEALTKLTAKSQQKKPFALVVIGDDFSERQISNFVSRVTELPISYRPKIYATSSRQRFNRLLISHVNLVAEQHVLLDDLAQFYLSERMTNVVALPAVIKPQQAHQITKTVAVISSRVSHYYWLIDLLTRLEFNVSVLTDLQAQSTLLEMTPASIVFCEYPLADYNPDYAKESPLVQYLLPELESALFNVANDNSAIAQFIAQLQKGSSTPTGNGHQAQDKTPDVKTKTASTSNNKNVSDTPRPKAHSQPNDLPAKPATLAVLDFSASEDNNLEPWLVLNMLDTVVGEIHELCDNLGKHWHSDNDAEVIERLNRIQYKAERIAAQQLAQHCHQLIAQVQAQKTRLPEHYNALSASVDAIRRELALI